MLSVSSVQRLSQYVGGGLKNVIDIRLHQSPNIHHFQNFCWLLITFHDGTALPQGAIPRLMVPPPTVCLLESGFGTGRELRRKDYGESENWRLSVH
jgi:hypothetical protein